MQVDHLPCPFLCNAGETLFCSFNSVFVCLGRMVLRTSFAKIVGAVGGRPPQQGLPAFLGISLTASIRNGLAARSARWEGARISVTVR